MFARKQDEARWDLQTNYLSVSVYMKTDTDTVFKMSFSFIHVVSKQSIHMMILGHYKRILEG